MREAILPLKLVHPELSAAGRYRLDCSLQAFEDRLMASFEIDAPYPIHANPGLASDASQWGLWDWDVVELFVSTSPRCYYEFQVSPLGQYFELQIFEPRKKFDREYRSGAKFSATRFSDRHWRGEMVIPASAIEWDGDPSCLKGNAYAILGAAESKTYWSAFLPRQAAPDFHLPERFKPLFGP